MLADLKQEAYAVIHVSQEPHEGEPWADGLVSSPVSAHLALWAG